MDEGLCPRFGHLQGTVMAVYRAAIYVRPDDGTELVTLALDDVGGLPGGVGLHGVGTLLDLGVLHGGRVLVVDRWLTIGSEQVRIDLAEAATWSPRLPPAARCVPGPRLDATLAVARRLAAAHAPGRGFGRLLRPPEPADSRLVDVPFLAVAAPRIADLGEALAADDRGAAGVAARGLIGLGIGLTPSGDDLIVGVLAGLRAMDHPAGPALAAEIAAATPGRTGPVSEVVLRQATRGAFAEPLHDLLVAIAGQRPASLVRAMARVLSCGSTSGADTLVGLLMALGLGDPSRVRVVA